MGASRGATHQAPRFPTYDASNARSFRISRWNPMLHWKTRGRRPLVSMIDTNGEDGGITPGAAGKGYRGLKSGQGMFGFPKRFPGAYGLPSFRKPAGAPYAG